uniref:Bifunctional inhibitor/plant lipid transfer protein/seed storage helical domain-containing protein n=1 Tax=Leersia perrieri TaxID=77586 RepID=A0A0D9VNB1_9ORYZ
MAGGKRQLVQDCPPNPPVVPSPRPPTPGGGGGGQCPINGLDLSVCAGVMSLLKLSIGVPDNEQCCPLLSGLVDLDAAICVCTAIQADILGIDLDVNVDLRLLLNFCGKTCPDDFDCPDN